MKTIILWMVRRGESRREQPLWWARCGPSPPASLTSWLWSWCTAYFIPTIMHSKVMSCVGPFPMAEWLRNVITGCVELLRGFCGAEGTSESTVSNPSIFSLFSFWEIPQKNVFNVNYVWELFNYYLILFSSFV